MEQKLDVEHRLTVVEDRSKSNTKRIDELERRQDNLDDLVSTVKVLALREENVESDVKEIKSDVKSLKEIPAKRWDGVVDKVLWAIAGAIGSYIAIRLGF
jgi:hypothetical protein